jgi:hypothetical protein
MSLFRRANNDPNLGLPTAQKHTLPMIRFFQENKTEVFELDRDGDVFEMFESMRVYIERNKRSYNYLQTVHSLNLKREDDLLQREAATAQAKDSERARMLEIERHERDTLVELQNSRLELLN